MPTRKLTDLFVERVKPARGRIEYFDAAYPALALRVTKKGAKSWCVFSPNIRRLISAMFQAKKIVTLRSRKFFLT